MDIRRIGNIPGDYNQAQKKGPVGSGFSSSSSDSIEISDSARAAQEASNLAKLAAAAPDARPEKVQEIRQALAEGVLLSQEATRRLAERLVDLIQ